MVEFFPEQAVFFRLGSFALRWYGIAYVFAFWVAWAALPALGARKSLALSRDQWTFIAALAALGVLIGGRIGYVIFYEPMYFFAHPGEIIRIWHGGMSSHGGFLGVALGLWAARRRIGAPLLAVADILCIPASFGLAIGRLANIANGEFGMYPYYEAAADGAIAAVCFAMLYRHSGKRHGQVFATFLLLYSIARFSLEYIRVQEWPIVWGFSLGQLYTIPLFLFGMLLLAYAYNSRVQSKV